MSRSVTLLDKQVLDAVADRVELKALILERARQISKERRANEAGDPQAALGNPQAERLARIMATCLEGKEATNELGISIHELLDEQAQAS